MQMTAHLRVGGINSGRGGAFSKSLLIQHQPARFTSDLKMETVNRFRHKVEHWVCQGGAAMDNTESDKRLNSAWRYMEPEVYSRFTHWIHQQNVTIIPPAIGFYAHMMWLLFESAFGHWSVPEVAITTVGKQIRTRR
jgi:hypothetical protein